MKKVISWKRDAIIVVLVISCFGLWFIQFNIDMMKQKKLSEKLVEELMYFPSGKFLKPTLIEYQAAMSDLVWLRAIQYYGQHLWSDRKFEWLNHIFDILTTLDTRFSNAYDFGSKMLAWDAKQVNEAEKLLNRGIINNPLDWQLTFDYAFIEYMKRQDYITAGYYFEIASKLPNAWNVTERWAAFAFKKGGDNELAVEIWSSIYYTTKNSRLKELAERRLIELGVKPKSQY
jgi:tetratricopeptide (TPR) repeat protein